MKKASHMIPNTPLGRYILVVVGEEPRSKAAMLAPVFDKEERDNDIIGSVTTLGGMTDLSPAILFERIGEISSALAKIDYSQESPVASTYVGDVPVSFQVLPESYGVSQTDEPDEPVETSDFPDQSEFLRSFYEGDVGVAIRIGDRSAVVAGPAADFVGMVRSPGDLFPLVAMQIDYLFATNPGALPLVSALLDDSGDDQGSEALTSDSIDGDPDDEDTFAEYIIAMPRDLDPSLLVEILDVVDNIELSKVGDDGEYTGYLVTVPDDEKISAVGAILDISPEISISAA